MFTLHFLLNFATVISVILIYTTTHPIYAVLLLVLIFCEAAITLFIFNIEFLSLVFIVVYIGAIAVLFLFVVMMLNIKSLKHSILKKFFNFGLLTGFFLSIAYFVFKNSIVNFNYFQINEAAEFNVNLFDTLNSLEILAQILYNIYPVCVMIVGLVLLIPLLGSIILTLNCDSINSNLITIRQLSRNQNTTTFFK